MAMPAVVGKVVSRLKWMMWLFRAYSILKSIKEIINFVDATHLTMMEISAELDKLCEKGKD